MKTLGNRLQGAGGVRTVLLWLIGALIWYFSMHAPLGTALQLKLTGVAIILGCIPAARQLVSVQLARIRTPSAGGRCCAAILIAVAASAVLLLVAYAQDWDFILRYQDEHSFMIQLQMLAHGRLWMPAIPPEVADFFSSYLIFTSPTYGSIYYPGTALMDVAGVWLHLPFWAIPVLSAGASVGLVYRIVTELVDGVAEALAALMMISLPTFRSLALMLLSQTPMLLLGLLLIWAWLRWRGDRETRWVLLIGALAGWALITRPLDALAYLVPVCWAMLAESSEEARVFITSSGTSGERRAGGHGAFKVRFDSDGPSSTNAPRRGPAPDDQVRGKRNFLKVALALLPVVALFVLSAAPFLAVQAIQNKAMTLRWTVTPEGEFAAENFPGPMVGFHQIDWHRALRPNSPKILS